MDSLYIVQLDNFKSIKNATTNFKKCPKARLTKAYVKVRVENLDKHWEIFQETHREILMKATAEQRKNHEYFAKDVYCIGEEEYLNTKADMFEILEQVQPSDITGTEAQSIRPQCQEVKLPKINIPQFNGNYNDWGTFKDLYTSLIHNQSSLSPVQKLHYLKSCLIGEAEQLLKHIQITEKNYEVAWKTLHNRYNNKRIVVNTILNRFLGQKKLSVESAKGVKELLDTTSECLHSLKNNDISIDNWDPIIIHLLVNKLDAESHKQWEEDLKTLSVEELPTLDRFSAFLEGRFRVLEMIQTAHPREKPQLKTKAFHAIAPHSSTTDSKQQCGFCNEDHFIFNCKEFTKLDPEQRSQEVQTRGLCFNCLRSGHGVRFCKRNTSCLRCKRKHHTLLHVTKPYPVLREENNENENKEQTTPPIKIISHCASQSQVTLLATALVNITTSRGAQVVRALIDPCSQESFITEETARKLQLKRTKVDGHVTGVGKMSTPIKHAAEIEVVSRINDNYKMKCTAYVIKQVTEIIPVTKIDVKQWTHLHGLELADPTYHNPGKIDLLLGVNVYTDILMSGVIKGEPGSPLAQQTLFGWIISGGAPTEYGKNGRIVSMHLNVSLDNMLQRFWESDTLEIESKHTLTPLETRAEEIYENTLARDKDGRFIVGLPFARDTPILPEHSRTIAVKRLECLERKLAHNSKLKTEYDNVIKEYLTLSHMERVDKPNGDMKTVYLPHHAVVREDRETTKVRVVFDASCKGSNGVSLNDELLVGPTLLEELRDVIMRWRQHKICFVADIVKMYRQIKVRETDTDYQRIVYRFDPNEEIQDFRMLTVTFGTASAPYLAIRTLKQLAKEERVAFPTASEIINRDFYMDDVLTGFDDVKSALEAHEQLQEVMSKRGFELQKWASNSEEFMSAIQPEKRENSTTLDMNRKSQIKTLGIIWNIDEDNLKVTQKGIDAENAKPVTKRNVLAQIASLFDPLGWLAPAIMTAKRFMQKLWLEKLDWDEELPADLKEEWVQFQDDLPALSDIQLPRWTGSSRDSAIELHGFSDASPTGYAAVVYIRVVYKDGSQCQVSLITAKTKVAPVVKPLSLPRLELCGAFLLSKLMKHVMKVLNIELQQTYAWVDSKVVLAWLKGDPNRWTPYVKNRVLDIRSNLDTHWLYVNTKENPADPASRGLFPSKLKHHQLWFSGPDFLHQPDFNVPVDSIPETDLEKRLLVKCKTTTLDLYTEKLTLLKKYSSLQKLVDVVAYCRRWLKVLKKEKEFTKHITCEEKDEALTLCLKMSQEIEFPDEINALKNGKAIKKSSRLLPFTPYLDDKGLLRLGGRLKYADLSMEQKHPILITKDNALLPVLLDDAHKNTLHGGPHLMTPYLRSKYWIIKGGSSIKHFYRKCVTCARYNAKTSTQLMGNLPEVRVKPSRPFLVSGVDFAGPITCRMSKGRGAKTFKAYIALFICMSTKAIHLELVSDMTTDAFIAAFKRFVSRRGHCMELWSDHGTTFVAAEKELLKMWQQGRNEVPEELLKSLDDKGIRWRYIPPGAPNFGGLWEAGVKSTKYHLKRILRDSTLTFEEMYTVLTQIEACLNSRPLTPLGDNLDYLSPAHFLVGEPLISLPDRSYEQSTISSLSRWQLTQRMLRDFWKKWQTEYLSRLQLRPKWNTPQKDLELDELVLIKDPRYPPANWRVGRVLKKYTGTDGLTRMYDIRTAFGITQRPITKLCRLSN